MTPDHELVARIAEVLRTEVAPATEGAQPRSQAFRASAVLKRLARRLELADAHAAAAAEDRRALAADLDPLPDGVDAPALAAAIVALAGTDAADAAGGADAAEGTDRADGADATDRVDAGTDHKAALARLVAALYEDRPRMPDCEFERLLARVRLALRADLDRDLDVAR